MILPILGGSMRGGNLALPFEPLASKPDRSGAGRILRLVARIRCEGAVPLIASGQERASVPAQPIPACREGQLRARIATNDHPDRTVREKYGPKSGFLF